MKIALFCPTVSGRGGMETAILSLLAGFRAQNDDCRLFMLGGSHDWGWLKGVSYTLIGTPNEPKLLRLTRYAVQPAIELARWKPDAVIAADVTTLRMALFARRLVRLRKMTIASWIHFPVADVRMKEHLHEADCHLAISSGIADQIRTHLPEQADRTFTIFNGLEMNSVSLLPRAERPVFVYIGRLTYDDQKRVNDFLQALALLRGDFSVKIIGAAPKLRAEDGLRLRALADELGLTNRIEWMGWRSDPWKAVGSASALVLTSAYEGFGMILLESISRSLPCISSDCESGPKDIIEDGKNGWLYPVGDVSCLAALMQRVIDRPESLPNAGVVQASAHKFSAEAVASRAREALLAMRR